MYYYIFLQKIGFIQKLIQQFDSFDRVFVWEKLDSINMGQYGMMYNTLTLS